MSYQSYTPWSYTHTPKSITGLIIITAIMFIGSSVLEPLFNNVFRMYGPQEFFGLSWWGLSNYYLWQPVTCLFVDGQSSGISISFLIALTINLYMVWLFGSNLVETHGIRSFLGLYFISGILASLFALFLIPRSQPFHIIAGLTPSLLAIFVTWASLHRETQLLLFFLIPVKTKWLLAAVLAVAILIPLSNFDMVGFVYYAVGILIGYLYSTLGWQTPTPFNFMEKIDHFFIELGHTLKTKIRRLSSSSNKENNKVVDIKTGKAVLDDEAFIDEMLSKISRYGEKSLTWQERNRMKKISEEKLKK